MAKNFVLVLLLISHLSFLFADVVVPDGFKVMVLPIGTEVDGLATAPDGPYGDDTILYAAVEGRILQIDTSSGTVSTFATGLATGFDRPSGLAFDRGTFGTGHLYVSQNNGSVVRVMPDGSVSTFSSGGSLFSSNDLAFAPPDSDFGNNLFVTNGDFGSGFSISQVDSAGANSIFVPGMSFAQVPVGVAFPKEGSAFGSDLFASLANGTIAEITPDATLTTFATGLGLAIDLDFGSGDAFGDNLYVTDPNTQRVLMVDSDGNVSTFATGFNFTSSGFDADLTFNADGTVLYVANNTNIVVITVAE